MKSERSQQKSLHLKVIAIGILLLFVIIAGGAMLQHPSFQTVLGASTTSCSPCQWWNIGCKLKGIFSWYPCVTPTLKQTSTHGIYQFVGQQDPTNAIKPYLKGALLNYYWSQIEPTKGNFQWHIIDTDMHPWVTAGKSVIIRISTSGNCYSNQAGSCNRTPSWVYADGTRSVKDTITGAVYPVFWDQSYLTDLQQFLQAFATRYDTNPSVVYIDASVANDGETVVSKDTTGRAYPLWQPYGYTDSLWLSTIKKIISFYGQSFHTKPIAVQPDKTFIQPKKTKGALSEMALLNAVVQLHFQYPNLMFQNDSLLPNKTLPPIWNELPLSYEQLHTTEDATTLQEELQTGENQKASYILIYTKDIDNSANQTVLQNAANSFNH